MSITLLVIGIGILTVGQLIIAKIINDLAIKRAAFHAALEDRVRKLEKENENNGDHVSKG